VKRQIRVATESLVGPGLAVLGGITFLFGFVKSSGLMVQLWFDQYLLFLYHINFKPVLRLSGKEGQPLL
jgi:hypothetical protein